MPNKPTRIQNWSKGGDNVAQPDQLPPNSVRLLLNLDATAGGTLKLRAGYRQAVAVDGVRAVGSVGSKILIAADDGLSVYDTATDSVRPLDGTLGDGKIAMVSHNRQLYIASPSQTWRYDGQALKPWGLPEPAASFTLAEGNLTGTVKVAVTALGDDDEESGCDPYVFSLKNQKILLSTSDERRLRLYVSPPNHESLYFQTHIHGGTATISNIRDETESLVTADLRPFPACSMLATHHGVIVGAYDRYVMLSEPMMPHLHNPVTGFFQYAAPVTLLAPTDGGVFVGTEDATYFLSSIESTPAQRLAVDFGAVAGTSVALPDGRAAWFTRYGQAIGTADGAVTLINKDRLSPEIATDGAAALVEHQGNQMLVTTMRGPVRTSGLGIGFHSELEID